MNISSSVLQLKHSKRIISSSSSTCIPSETWKSSSCFWRLRVERKRQHSNAHVRVLLLSLGHLPGVSKIVNSFRPFSGTEMIRMSEAEMPQHSSVRSDKSIWKVFYLHRWLTSVDFRWAHTRAHLFVHEDELNEIKRRVHWAAHSLELLSLKWAEERIPRTFNPLSLSLPVYLTFLVGNGMQQQCLTLRWINRSCHSIWIFPFHFHWKEQIIRTFQARRCSPSVSSASRKGEHTCAPSVPLLSLMIIRWEINCHSATYPCRFSSLRVEFAWHPSSVGKICFGNRWNVYLHRSLFFQPDQNNAKRFTQVKHEHPSVWV